MIRSGDEPSHARSPLRLRLALAALGLVSSLGSATWCAAHGLGPLTIAFVLVAGVAVVDLVVVATRIRRGPHWQPARDVPPYTPLPPQPPSPRRPLEARSADVDAARRRRLRRYLWVMGTFLALIVNAWTWVRLVDKPVAVAMSLVAMVLPPIAAILGSPPLRGPWPEHPETPERPETPGDREQR